MIEVRAFELSHLEQIKPREVFNADSQKITTATYRNTFFVGDHPIAVFGGELIHAGVAEVWALFSDGVKHVPIEFFRKTLRLILLYIGHYKLHRMHLSVREDFAVGHRFVEKLGFQREGVMRRFGTDGSNYVLFARVC